jgi:restriction system protein
MNIHIQTEWSTPTGKPRNVPVYSATIRNAFLGMTRTFRGSDRGHVTGRASSQLQKWAEQESRQKAAAAKQDAIERGEAETASLDTDAKEAIEAVSNLLRATLSVDDRIDWNELRDVRVAGPFFFPEPMPPVPDTTPRQIQVHYLDRPPTPWYISFWPGAQARWEARCATVDAENRQLHEQLLASQQGELARCQAVQAAHDDSARAWNQRRAAAHAKYVAECETFAQAQGEHNTKIEQFKQAFEQGSPQAVKEYLRGVFERSDYPPCFTVQHSVEFDARSKHAAVELEVPAQDDFPSVSGYSYVRSKREARATVLKKKERSDLYESALAQVVLRTLHEVFEADYAGVVSEASASAFVTALDPSTGNERRTALIAISATRGNFLELDLHRVDPLSCARRFSASSIATR